MLELAHRWQELIGEFTDESAHYDGAATDDLCSAFSVLAALELRPVGHS